MSIKPVRSPVMPLHGIEAADYQGASFPDGRCCSLFGIAEVHRLRED